VDVLERAHGLIAHYEALARSELPSDAVLFDAHTHLGNDIDGMIGEYEELAHVLGLYRFAGAFVFCLDEHDREPAFRSANDRTLAHAERSEGLLIPFVRLDLEADPVEEAIRCLDAGARGIKLHPRAQRFTVADSRLEPVFELAAERQVPILIHGGRGLPPISDHLATLIDRTPGVEVIIAHAGIADMAGLAGRLGGIRGVYFDTSVWGALDLLDLFRQVSPEQVLYASDYPYGRQPNSLLVTVRAARASGCDDALLRLVLGEGALRIARGEPQAPLTQPRGGSSFSQPLTFARIHQYLAMSTPLFWLRQGDVMGSLGLAINASRERDGFPETSDRIHELLATALELWTTSRKLEDDDERTRIGRISFRLVHLADILAVTTHA
jgi:uncharacterized protein